MKRVAFNPMWALALFSVALTIAILVGLSNGSVESVDDVEAEGALAAVVYEVDLQSSGLVGMPFSPL